MQLGMKILHDYSALYVMTSNLNVECKLQWDFFNTIGGKRKVRCGGVNEQEPPFTCMMLGTAMRPKQSFQAKRLFCKADVNQNIRDGLIW